jgi:hypothetical protein
LLDALKANLLLKPADPHQDKWNLVTALTGIRLDSDDELIRIASDPVVVADEVVAPLREGLTRHAAELEAADRALATQ